MADKRMRRAVGEAKGRSEIGESYIWYRREMVASPALRVLSRVAILVMRRIEHEHMLHGGADNGKLQVTYLQFEEWGVHSNYIGSAIRELVALGFLEVTAKGHAGAAGKGKAHRFRLTYVASKHRVAPSDEWARIKTLEDAERIAKAARNDKDCRASDLGRRGAKSAAQKKKSASQTEAEPPSQTEAERPIFQPHKLRLHASASVTEATIYSLGEEPVPPSLTTPIADVDDGATNLTAAVSPKLIWTKPIVRELFGEEKRRLLSALAT
jgi:hypothetical protein